MHSIAQLQSPGENSTERLGLFGWAACQRRHAEVEWARKIGTVCMIVNL